MPARDPALIAKEREVLADKLLQSLDDAPLTDVEEAWLEEAEKRYQAYRKGRSKGIPADQLFAEIRSLHSHQG